MQETYIKYIWKALTVQSARNLKVQADHGATCASLGVVIITWHRNSTSLLWFDRTILFTSNQLLGHSSYQQCLQIWEVTNSVTNMGSFCQFLWEILSTHLERIEGTSTCVVSRAGYYCNSNYNHSLITPSAVSWGLTLHALSNCFPTMLQGLTIIQSLIINFVVVSGYCRNNHI